MSKCKQELKGAQLEDKLYREQEILQDIISKTTEQYNKAILDSELYGTGIMTISLKDYEQQIRKQVCDEIREKIKNRNEAYPIICEDENQIVHRCIFLDDIKQFLDQIEKGENKNER